MSQDLTNESNMELSPEDETFLQQFLSEAETPPPEGYTEAFINKLSPHLADQSQPSVLLKATRLIKGNRKLLSAVAVMAFAIVLPMKMLDSSFFKGGNTSQVSSTSVSESETNRKPRSMVLGSGMTDKLETDALKNEEGFGTFSKSRKKDNDLGDVQYRSELDNPASQRERAPRKKINKLKKLVSKPSSSIIGDRLSQGAKRDLDETQIAMAPLKEQKQRQNMPVDRLSVLKNKESRPDVLRRKIHAPPPVSPASSRGYNVEDYLVRRGSIELEVREIQKGFTHISKVLRDHKGYIVSSDLQHYEKSQSRATLQIKVPTKGLMNVIELLEQEGVVRKKSIKSEDIWLKVQRERLHTERLQDQIAAEKKKNKTKSPSLVKKYQLKEQELQNQQYKHMMTYSTLYLTLFEKPSQWNLNPVSDRAWRKLQRSLRNTIDMLTDIVTVLPPVFIFLGMALVIWKLLSFFLVQRLALVSTKVLGGTYVTALIFFPLYFMGEGIMESVLLFVSLIALVWGGNLFFNWAKEIFQSQEKLSASLPVDDTEGL